MEYIKDGISKNGLLYTKDNHFVVINQIKSIETSEEYSSMQNITIHMGGYNIVFGYVSKDMMYAVATDLYKAISNMRKVVLHG